LQGEGQPFTNLSATGWVCLKVLDYMIQRDMVRLAVVSLLLACREVLQLLVFLLGPKQEATSEDSHQGWGYCQPALFLVG